MTDDMEMKIAKLQMSEGDVLVVKVKGYLWKFTHDRIMDHFNEILPGCRKIIIGEEIELSVLTPPNSESAA